jgi:hypothetical protein
MGNWMPYVTGGYANAAYHFYGRTRKSRTRRLGRG